MGRARGLEREHVGQKGACGQREHGQSQHGERKHGERERGERKRWQEARRTDVGWSWLKGFVRSAHFLQALRFG